MCCRQESAQISRSCWPPQHAQRFRYSACQQRCAITQLTRTGTATGVASNTLMLTQQQHSQRRKASHSPRAPKSTLPPHRMTPTWWHCASPGCCAHSALSTAASPTAPLGSTTSFLQGHLYLFKGLLKFYETYKTPLRHKQLLAGCHSPALHHAG